MTRLLRFLPILLILAACTLGQSAPTLPAPTADALATAVAATLDAALAQATLNAPASATPAPTATEPPPTPTEAQTTASPSPTPASAASVSGSVCFKGGQIPALTAYFIPKQGEAVTLPIAAGQRSYEVNLPPGEYTAYAWTQDFSFGVSYSQAVLCGLGAACDDHTLVTFTVIGEQPLSGIDLCDTTHGPFDVPLPPGVQPQTATAIIGGAMSGYPGGSAPVLRVVAFNQNTGFWYWIEVPAGAGRYLFTNLPPGTYQMVAYAENGTTGGYPALVTVAAGQTVTDASITDWQGSYPPDPTR
ncbi:MAG: hypothetical protein OHK0052_07550 [Anaerolineales bacterium]